MARALLLNASFEPLGVVPVRRAVVLVLKEKAEIISRNGHEFHAERVVIPAPSVIRLHRYVKIPGHRRVPLNRRAIFVRDSFQCQYCNRPAENIDHVIPRSRGGSHTWNNVVASCRACNARNARKENRLLHETGMKLPHQPRVPHAQLWVLATAGSIDPDWVPYLPNVA